MSFDYTLSKNCRKTLDKLAKKDRKLAIAVRKKINQITNSNKFAINHFKNLKGGLKDYKRVHVGSFVLIFKVEKEIIIFDRFVHHNQAY